jgi:hypothetical protein
MDPLRCGDLLDLCGDPVRRRWFLLVRAMEHLPLEDAATLAERIEAFLSAGRSEPPVKRGAPTSRSEQEVIAPSAPAAPPVTSPVASARAQDDNVPPPPLADKPELLSRLAEGASDADIIAEFGLTKRQLVGFRLQMGNITGDRASAEEVVRFLRQQGDVVTGQARDGFLVNGRFRLTYDDLVERANRIRARHGKKLFTADRRNSDEIVANRERSIRKRPPVSPGDR